MIEIIKFHENIFKTLILAVRDTLEIPVVNVQCSYSSQLRYYIKHNSSQNLTRFLFFDGV